MTGLEGTLRLPKPGTYINLLLEHSRKCTTTSLGGSCRVDAAFIQLLFTDTHQGQNWSLHFSESLVPYLWKHGAWRILCKLLTASLASEHLCCSVPMTVFITFWSAGEEFKPKGNSSCSVFSTFIPRVRNDCQIGGHVVSQLLGLDKEGYICHSVNTHEDQRRDLAYFTLSAIHFWIIFFTF